MRHGHAWNMPTMIALVARSLLWPCCLLITIAGSVVAAAEPAPSLSAEQQRELDSAKALNDTVAKMRAQGRYGDAIRPAQQVVEIRKRVLGDKHPEYATSLNNLAVLYKSTGDYARAEPLFRQASEIQKSILGDRHPHYATSLNNLGALYDDMGDYAQAEPLFRRAAEIAKEALGDKHPEYATDLNNLARLYFSMGDYARAEPLMRQALEIRKAALGEKHPDYAETLNNLAVLYKTINDYARAEPLYRQVVEIDKVALGDKHADYASDLNNLAVLYKAMGEYTRAEPLYRQAMEIDKAALGDEHPRYATDLNNLAHLNFSIGAYAKAEDYFRRVLEIRKSVVGEKHPDYATGLNSLAQLELTIGRPGEAEKLARQATEIQRKCLDLAGAVQSERQQLAMVGGVRYLLDCYLTAALAAGASPEEMYSQAAAWKGAVSAQQQQMRAREHALAADPSSELAKLFVGLDEQSRKLASLYRYTPKSEEAEKFRQASRASAEAVEEIQRRLAQLDLDFHRAWAERSLSSDVLHEALPGGAALVDLLEYWHYIPKPKPREKERWERRYLAFVLHRGRSVDYIELGPAAPINELVGAWRRNFGRAPTNISKPPGDELRRIVWNPLAAVLAGTETVLVSPDGALAQLPWAALPGEKSGTFLLEERQLAVIAVPQMLPELLKSAAHSSPPASLLLAGDIDYGGDPGASHDKLAVRAAASRRNGAAQFANLQAAQVELSSIQDRYKQAVGSGDVYVLGQRNATEALFRSQAQQHTWLHLITHGFFAGSLPSGGSPTAPTVAGIGVGLDIGGGRCLVTQLVANGAAANDGRLEPGDEVTAIAQSTGDWTPAAGKDLAAIVVMIRGPVGTGVRLKIRSHDKPDVETELSLTRVAFTAPQPATDSVDPGLLSGLAFAGANAPLTEGKDDGILTALEVSALDLSKVDTVVLSACETGLGQSAGGEGLLGLQRAFQIAGAKSVVASLWKVPDRATQMLMVRFYENLWQKKMPKLAALREAQLWMLREVPKHPELLRDATRGLELEPASAPASAETSLSPRFWAAFVLSGDWR